LTAVISVREARFVARHTYGFADAVSFAAAADHPTEREAARLSNLAEFVVDTSSMSIREMYEAILQSLELDEG